MSDPTPDPSCQQVITLYDANVPAWSEARGDGTVEHGWLQAFMATLPGRDVLDIGCGTGEPIARLLTGAGAQVTGIDAAPAMIAAARESFPDGRWIRADMREMPDLGRFDGLIAWDSLFHLTPADQRSVLAALPGVARPGAALMFTSGTELGQAIGTFGGQPLYHGSLATAEYRALLDLHGFDVLRHVVSDPACGGRTIWLARAR